MPNACSRCDERRHETTHPQPCKPFADQDRPRGCGRATPSACGRTPWRTAPPSPAANSANPSPWNTLTTRSPPGCSIDIANSSASSPRCTRAPGRRLDAGQIGGHVGDHKVDACAAERLLRPRPGPRPRESRPGRRSRRRRRPSAAGRWPRSAAVGPSRSRSTCDQLPGAAPRSTTRHPGRSSWSFSASSISLNAARER